MWTSPVDALSTHLMSPAGSQIMAQIGTTTQQTGKKQGPLKTPLLEYFAAVFQKQHGARNVPTCVLIKPVHQAGESQYHVIYACVSPHLILI